MAESSTVSTVEDVNPRKLTDQSVELWSTSNVKSWLQGNSLQKFCYLVDKYKITGKDLEQLKLDFLNDVTISVEDREVFLSEIYHLVKPAGSNMANSPDDREPRDSWERDKYLAALQVAQVRRARSQSSSVLLCSETSSSSPKLRSRRCSLFDSLKLFGPQCIQCVQLNRSDNGFGFTCSPMNQGLVTVLNISSPSVVKKGDIILEMNGILLIRGDNSVEVIAERMLRNSQCLQLVYLREMRNDVMKTAEDRNIHHELCASEKKWRHLQDMLYSMKTDPVDTVALLSEIPDQQIWDMKRKYSEQANIDEMKEELAEKESTLSDLQRALVMKSQEVKMMETQRNAALVRLHSPTEAKANGHSSDVYKPLWEKFESAEVSKEDILKSLKEVMFEAGQQKLYFDHLLSVVIQRAPELLEEVDTSVQDLSSNQSSDREEFC
ncbi:uncharacterized protein LOC121367525 [Gigantopelta aegis]|uniref:uncharacterized protein LOC121367525 n=1 Tax=Gigantopelta aegis TaxID=1735272 RepID=UPI001B88CD4E|nr:uncharacterized protein LOC121367525 [Gigantopelta aegis]